MGDLDLMKIADKVKNEFYSLGYKDAELGRKLSDADCFILSEAKRIVHAHLIEINDLTEDYCTILKTKKELLNIDSKEHQLWKKNKIEKKELDEINEAINILNNEISDIEKDIKSLKLLYSINLSDEIESTFGAIHYHYQTGYLTFKHYNRKDRSTVQSEIDYSALTTDIIDQYARNLEFGKENLD